MSITRKPMFSQYFVERFPIWLLVAMPSLLTAAATWGDGLGSNRTFGLDWQSMFGAFVLVAVMFIALRLWDDLADREVDRISSPGRVLTRLPSVRPFQYSLGILLVGIAIVLVAFGNWPGVLLWTGLVFVLAIWYGNRFRWRYGAIANYHVVLLKYPAMILIATQLSHGHDIYGFLRPALAVYLALCIAEVVHDKLIRQIVAARILALAEVSLLLFVVGYGLKCLRTWSL